MRAILLCSLPLMLTGAAAADTFVSESREAFVHEAKARYYKRKEYPIGPSGPSALRARFTIESVQPDRTYAPSVIFHVYNGDVSVKFSVVFRDTGTRKRLLGELSRRDGKERPVKLYQYVARVGDPVEVQMTWAPSGTVTATWTAKMQPEQHTVELGAPPQRVEVTVSGAKANYSSLEFGRIQRD